MKRELSLSGLGQRFSDKLTAILDQTDLSQSVKQHGLVVAYSGGLDSSVLLHLASDFCKRSAIPLYAFHVHHGISSNADAWLTHAAAVCNVLNVPFDYAKVRLEQGGNGIEAEARTLRYRALGAFCQKKGVSLLLTAHHQDDQAETILMQLLRGAGVSGLSGMDVCSRAPVSSGDNPLLVGRPLLDVTRQLLEAYAGEHKLSYVNDESNQDTRYLRNALRHRVMPVLEELQPGFAARIARSGRHLATADHLIRSLSEQDYRSCESDGVLNLVNMKTLPTERISLVLRTWLARQGVRMPSEARLNEIVKQVCHARRDAQITIRHEDLFIHCYRDQLYASTGSEAECPHDVRTECQWREEPELYLPDFHGSLIFKRGNYGLDAAWLGSVELEIHHRRGGERLKTHAQRPARDMKTHYQYLGIPFWMRNRLPYVSVDGQLIFAAGVGMDVRHCINGDGCIQLEWRPD